jgi:hypothetical protein
MNSLPKWYVSAKKRLSHIFVKKNFKGVTEESVSPCGSYFFIVTKYSTDPRWCYYHGFICREPGWGPSFAEIQSTASKFWHCWVVNEGKLYLICNEDTQGYTVVDVENRKIHPYLDPKANGGWRFSWKEVKPSPDGKILAVQGDYAETSREISIFDFSNPTNPPFAKIKRLDTNLEQGHYVLKGWKDNKVVVEHIQPHQEPTIVEIDIHENTNLS